MIHIYTSVSTPRRLVYSLILTTVRLNKRLCCDLRECVCFMASSSQSASCERSVLGLSPQTPACESPGYARMLDNSPITTAPVETKTATNARVRWSWLRRSGKVRGWHFNSAYVIYGACRASLAKLFETETQFIGLEWSSDLTICSAESWISTQGTNLRRVVKTDEPAAKTRPGLRRNCTQLNVNLMWFCSECKSFSLSRWLCPWTSRPLSFTI